MKRILALTAAALMGASVLTAPVFAQDANTETGGPANADEVMKEDQMNDGAGIPAEDEELTNENYETGGPANTDAAMDDEDVSDEQTGSVRPEDEDLAEEEYETGGSSNAEDATDD